MIATSKKRRNLRLEFIPGEKFLADVRTKFGEDAPISCNLADAKGRHLFMREDEVDTGGTAAATARLLAAEHRAASVRLVATHPVCSRGWKMRLFPVGEEPLFQNIWLGNTRPRGDGETRYEGSTGSRVKHVDMAPAIAETLVKALERLAE